VNAADREDSPSVAVVSNEIVRRTIQLEHVGAPPK